MATGSLPNVVRFPRGKKRGAKVKQGPCATVIQLLPDSVAVRYAKLMTTDCHPDERAEAMEDYMDFAIRLAQSGFTRDDLEQMKQKKRARLLRSLEALDAV